MFSEMDVTPTEIVYNILEGLKTCQLEELDVTLRMLALVSNKFNDMVKDFRERNKAPDDLQYYHQMTGIYLHHKINWCCVAAGFGSMELLKEARSKGCQWRTSAVVAARLGNAEILKYILDGGGRLTTEVIDNAVKSENVECFLLCAKKDILLAYRTISKLDRDDLFEACHNNNLLGYMVKLWHGLGCLPDRENEPKIWRKYIWLGYPSNTSIGITVSEMSDRELFHRIVEQGRVSNGTCNLLAARGDLELLKIALESGSFKLTTKLTAMASRNGHLECLKYLHERGCEWDYSAVMYGNQPQYECFFYILENSKTNRVLLDEICVCAKNGMCSMDKLIRVVVNSEHEEKFMNLVENHRELTDYAKSLKITEGKLNVSTALISTALRIIDDVKFAFKYRK